MYIVLFYIMSLSTYFSIFYFSYVYNNENLVTKLIALGVVNFLYALYWGYFTNIYHEQKQILVVVSLANTIIAFSAYNVLPHIYFKLKFNYLYLGISVVFAALTLYFLIKAMPKNLN